MKKTSLLTVFLVLVIYPFFAQGIAGNHQVMVVNHTFPFYNRLVIRWLRATASVK